MKKLSPFFRVVILVAWLVSSLYIFATINIPFVKILRSEISSWGMFVALIAIPRIIYSVLAMGGLFLILWCIFTKKSLKEAPSKKYFLQLLVIILVVSGIFFILIFPKKIFSIHLPPPPHTDKIVYKYEMGSVSPDSVGESATVHFYTSAIQEEIISFYKDCCDLEIKIHKSEYDDYQYLVLENWHGYFDIENQNGKNHVFFSRR